MEIPSSLLTPEIVGNKIASDEETLAVEEIAMAEIESSSNKNFREAINAGRNLQADALVAFQRNVQSGDTVDQSLNKLGGLYEEDTLVKLAEEISPLDRLLGVTHVKANLFASEDFLQAHIRKNPHIGTIVMDELPHSDWWRRANPMRVIPQVYMGRTVVSSENLSEKLFSPIQLKALTIAGYLKEPLLSEIKSAKEITCEHAMGLEALVKDKVLSDKGIIQASLKEGLTSDDIFIAGSLDFVEIDPILGGVEGSKVASEGSEEFDVEFRNTIIQV